MESSEEYEKLVWPIMTSCRLFACWPERDEEGAAVNGRLRSLGILLRRCHRGFVIFVIVIMCLGATADVTVFWGEDMNETIESSLVTSACYMAFMRVLVFSLKRRDMRDVVEIMRRDWISSTIEERLVLRDKCLLGYKLAKFFIISVSFASSTFVLMPIIEQTYADEEKRILPFPSYFFFNHTVSPTYEYVYSINALFGLIGCSTIAGGTTFGLISTIHGSAKFALVQKDFEAIDATDWVSAKNIKKCVQRHQESISYAEKVENVINLLALAQFVVSTGLMCFAGFQLTTMMEDKARMMKYSSFLNSAIMELFIFSYSGQKLKSESEDVGDCAYASNWVGCFSSANFQMVVMRSRKPCTITAGKFYDMSLESFLKVLSSSFSYFTVLLAMKEE